MSDLPISRLCRIGLAICVIAVLTGLGLIAGCAETVEGTAQPDPVVATSFARSASSASALASSSAAQASSSAAQASSAARTAVAQAACAAVYAYRPDAVAKYNEMIDLLNAGNSWSAPEVVEKRRAAATAAQETATRIENEVNRRPTDDVITPLRSLLSLERALATKLNGYVSSTDLNAAAQACETAMDAVRTACEPYV